MITKYTRLTKYDKAEKGSICEVILTDNQIAGELYIQINDNDVDPCWVPIGQFLQKVFRKCLDNEEFIAECMRLYHNKKSNPYAKIIGIMNEVYEPDSSK
jgi:hypothetical protein